jgi:hypothetical protein
MNIHRIYGLFLPFFRRRRMLLFQKIMRPRAEERILDVGGYHGFWDSAEFGCFVTCCNLHIPSCSYDTARFAYVLGDGRKLSFKDEEFDIAFSNSVIEHVGSFDDQKKFADEIRRVGKSYWVQTPNKWFFVEPHLVAPFVHYLPHRFQRTLIRYCTPWGLATKPSQGQVDDFLKSTRLLAEAEVRSLFPDGEIYREKFLLFTKSFVVYKR